MYISQSLKCESSLLFQIENANHLCQWKLIFHHRTPFLQCYGELWVYHFPKQQQITLLWAHDNKKVLCTLSLTRKGLLHNATGCSITSDAVQIFLELHETMQTKMDAPILHLPDITVITNFELQQLINIPPLDIQKLSNIHNRVAASLQTYDVESLLHTRETSLLQKKWTNYLITITTSSCTFIIFGIPCFILY